MINDKHRSREHGFTLIEVMVVVLIIGILLAIGIPTFLGARQRAQDRAAESTLRTVETAARLLADDQNSFLLDVSDLNAEEPSLTWLTTDSTGPKEVNVSSQTIAAGTAFSASVASESGACFHLTLRSDGSRFETRTQSGGCASVGGATAALSAVAADASLAGNFELDSDGFVGAETSLGYEETAGAGGTAMFTFTVAETGNYRLIGTVLGPTGGSDSFWIRTSLDGFSRVILWDLNAQAVRTDYVNDRNTGSQDVLFGIPAGTTLTVEVSQREAGAKISTLDLVPS